MEMQEEVQEDTTLANPDYLTKGGENCKKLREHFGKDVRVRIQDGRVFVGNLYVYLLLCLLSGSHWKLRVVSFSLKHMSTSIMVREGSKSIP